MIFPEIPSRFPCSNPPVEGAAGHPHWETGTKPTVHDLRQHIADDLQMSDSAEMLDLIVANKTTRIDLKLRVVHQVLWKNHLMEHSHSAGVASSLESTLAFLLAGSGGGARPSSLQDRVFP